ncbi:MAG: glycosyltransferase [Patescibacteria group bacterium]
MYGNIFIRSLEANQIKKMIVYSLLYLITCGIIVSIFIFPLNPNDNFPVLRKIIIFFAAVLLTKYFIYMILSPWNDVATAIKNKKDRHFNKFQYIYRPLVSVVIPAWNEEVGLLDAVKTVLKSNYSNVEVIVVNDGSTDNSHKIMLDYVNWYKEYNHSNYPINLKYYYKENAGKGMALNYGIEKSVGKIIISIDADCTLTPDTIGNFVKYFRDPRVMAAVGNVKIGNTNTILGTIQYLEFLFSFYFKKAESFLNTIYIIGGAAGAFRREVFDEVGFYNPLNITEDIDLSVRIQDSGMTIVYANDAVVYTEGASTIEGLIKQRLRWKCGRFQTFKEHKHLFFSTKNKHNKVLSWVILPLAVFGEIQLFLELYFVAFLFIYSYLTNDFSSFISGIIVVSTMFFVQMSFEDSSTRKFSFYILVPIGWLLFYVSTFVEYNALIKSMWGGIRKQEVVWQKWKRKGIIDKTI